MPDSNELKGAIADAQRLLKHASVNGIEVPSDLVGKIVSAQELTTKSSDDPTTFTAQNDFWLALSSLSALTRPATVDSVRHAAMTTTSPWAVRRAWLWSKLFRTEPIEPPTTSTAEKAVGHARLWALTALLLVAVFQFYYEVGLSTVTSYLEAKTVMNEAKLSDRALRESLKNLPAVKTSDTERERERIEGEIAKKGQIIADASQQANRRLSWMQTLMIWGQDGPKVEGGEPSAAERAEHLVGSLEGWLALLRNFALPIAWGFLGAAIYVSRALAEDIRVMAYAPARAILHRSRYYMGMVAGFVAAKFFPTSVGAEFGAVAPFAVALLVGYSVEVLFSLLDRLIGAFSTK